MALYLVQHGKALGADVDPERGLSEEGIAEVERIAGVAKGHGVVVGRVHHSGKKRARQTAELIAGALTPRNGIDQGEGLDPNDDVIPVVATVALRGSGFIAEVKRRPDVELWEVTRATRDGMPPAVLRWLAARGVTAPR